MVRVYFYQESFFYAVHACSSCKPSQAERRAFPSGNIPPFDVRRHFAWVMTLQKQGLYTSWKHVAYFYTAVYHLRSHIQKWFGIYESYFSYTPLMLHSETLDTSNRYLSIIAITIPLTSKIPYRRWVLREPSV